MISASEFMRAVCTERQDVLQEPLVVGDVRPDIVARILQSQPAEFRGSPVDHERVALRMEAVDRKERIVRAISRASWSEPIVTGGDTPHRHELPDRLQIA